MRCAAGRLQTAEQGLIGRGEGGGGRGVTVTVTNSAICSLVGNSINANVAMVWQSATGDK